MKFSNNKKGFTLVELIIVISILAILAAIAIPIAGNVLSNANSNADSANVSLYQSALERYVSSPTGGNGSYPSTATACVDAIELNSNVTANGSNLLPAPKTSTYHFYYNTVTHRISVATAAGTNDVIISQ